MAVHDITPVLGKEAPDWPGDPAFSRTTVAALAKGDACDLSLLHMSAHAGAHLDAPGHFIPGGRTLDSYPADAFILPALVAAIRHPEEIRVDELNGLETSSGMALLFQTDNSARGLTTSRTFSPDWVYLSREAASWCVERRLALVGIDALSIDRCNDAAHPTHLALLGAGILILEGINLREVEPGRHTLICLPLRVAGAEASPVRAVLTEYRGD